MKRNQCRVARILTEHRNDSNPKILKFILGREKERRKKEEKSKQLIVQELHLDLKDIKQSKSDAGWGWGGGWGGGGGVKQKDKGEPCSLLKKPIGCITLHSTPTPAPRPRV